MPFRLSPSFRYFGLSGMLVREQGSTDTPMNLEAVQNKLTVVPYFWNPDTLMFEVGRQPSTGGGAGSTVVDANITNPTTLVTFTNSVAGSTLVDARLTSAGTTQIAGYFSLTPTTPGSSQDYLWVRDISTGGGAASTLVDANLTSAGSTRTVGVVSQGVPGGSSADAWWVRTVSTGGGAGSTTVDANLTSAGSTRIVGRVDVNSISSSTAHLGNVTVSSGTVTLTSGAILGASTAQIGLTAQGTPAGSSAEAWWVRSVSTQTGGAGSTHVDANLTSLGATREVGIVSLTTSTGIKGAVSLASAGTTATLGQFAVSSGVVLGAGSSANTLGAVAQAPGSTSIAPWYVISSGGGAGSTTVDVANTPTVLPGSGSSGVAAWVIDGMRFSSGQTSHTTLATSAEQQLVAANANRRALIISNLSTAVELIIGFTTATVSTARANADFLIPANTRITLGGVGRDVPLYLGPVRGRLNSTTLAGIAAILQFTS